ncbi:energy transducer TonB [Qipengyuania marisflavi]|uniref:TonB family protein n=1 Tax=Qipengyuania marisflavi TaxID=2486356 RepID=A0A5S3P8I0_9SPHN|nr:energy transducer TonB [Qipengyuania marisflavi]TMM49726.1 TonB family protein [Qipengyuania marisflavi]
MRYVVILSVLALCSNPTAASAQEAEDTVLSEAPITASEPAMSDTMRCPSGGALVSSAGASEEARPTGRMRVDYPRAAESRRMTGKVKMQLVVGCDGRVKQCTVLQSSGHAILDSSACQSMLKYAVFRPATDENGNTIESTTEMTQPYALR